LHFYQLGFGINFPIHFAGYVTISILQSRLFCTSYFAQILGERYYVIIYNVRLMA